MSVHLPPGVDRERLLEPFADVSLYRGAYVPTWEVDAAYRREITRFSPLRFALVYMLPRLSSRQTRGVTSLSRFHVDMAQGARRWVLDDPLREGWIAPRGAAKSTWTLEVLPLWALAHGHRRFALAYGDSTDQIRVHLGNVRRELEENELLRQDFPELLPARGRGSQDNAATYVSRSGATFAARGMDAKTLGLKSGGDRPDLIILDDLEPSEANYSTAARDKRLDTVLHTILPMNEQAVVQLVGTVTMYGSISHALVRAAVGEGEPEPWISGTGIVPRYYPAIAVGEDGAEASMWPQRWPLEYLRELRAREPRNYALNFACRPPVPGGAHWRRDLFRYARPPLDERTMWLDVATTVTDTADYTAMAVVGPVTGRAGHVCVEYARAWRITGPQLRVKIRQALAANPDIRRVYLEANAGGGLWRDILSPMPTGVELVTYSASRAKDGRFGVLLDRYERGEVWHAEPLEDYERQAQQWPNVDHDDLIDAVAAGVAHYPGRAVGV